MLRQTSYCVYIKHNVHIIAQHDWSSGSSNWAAAWLDLQNASLKLWMWRACGMRSMPIYFLSLGHTQKNLKKIKYCRGCKQAAYNLSETIVKLCWWCWALVLSCIYTVNYKKRDTLFSIITPALLLDFYIFSTSRNRKKYCTWDERFFFIIVRVPGTSLGC